VTKKIAPLPPPRNPHARLIERLKCALDEAPFVGEDIADALRKLIASTARRRIEIEVDSLPDITDAAEAA